MTRKEAGGIIPPLLMDQNFNNSFLKLSDIVTGYKRYHVLIWALDSGIADILDHDGPMKPEVLLDRIGYRSELAGLWIDALVEISILERNGEFIRISQSLSPYLVSDSPLYQGDSFRSVRYGIWSNDADLLTGRKTSGKPVRGMNPDFLRIVYQHSMRGELQEITRILLSHTEFQSARRLLDIGGGHGMYTISFCQQNTNLSAVILDQPHITSFTREMVDKYGMGNRIEVVDGDMNIDLPGTGYDLIYASHILYRQANIPDLIHRITRILNDNGLFISNHKFEDDWKKPENDALATLENEITRSNHLMIPESVFLNNLKSEGFSRIQKWRVPANTGFSTIHTAF